MAVFRCKMCGGSLEIAENSALATCEYCGTRQTVPSADNEKKLALYSRANKLRFSCDFDKATGIYESIVTEFPEEAEAYWGLVLCKYGIEYVDDPASGKKIPTCHRSSFESVLDDDNFEMVMENANSASIPVYREEAKLIEGIRKGIVEVSSKEEPYDIFICYKETDEFGDRTIDSLIAQEIYDALTDAGYRVFFSRISLEDKLGMAYEPYIFAALNSARIMIVVGTDYLNFNAVWVKNEWSRFLQLIAGGEKKILIPCYKDIDAYDIPKEFKHLQAQDMGKVGANADLLRGIKKLLPKESNDSGQFYANPERNISSTSTVSSLLERGYIFLDDSLWEKADVYFERVLDIEPRNAKAYLGKLMAQLKISDIESLSQAGSLLLSNSNIKWIKKYGDSNTIRKVDEAIEIVREEETRKKNEENYRKNQIIDNSIRIIESDSIDQMIVFYKDLVQIIPWGNSEEIAEKAYEYMKSKIDDYFVNDQVNELQEVQSLMIAQNNDVYDSFIEIINEKLRYYDDETYVEQICPYCGETLSFSLATIKNNESVDCPFCMKKVDLQK